VPREVAVERLERLQALQREISAARLGESLGREVEVLLEGPAPDSPGDGVGRTPENRLVHVDLGGREPRAGDLVRVRVTRAGARSLGGEILG
jgi:tRNA-2-methylthio-N6-dimethylallyladenosine synthase